MAKHFGRLNKRRGSTPPVMKMRSKSHKERTKRQQSAKRKLERQKYFHFKNIHATGGTCSPGAYPTRHFARVDVRPTPIQKLRCARGGKEVIHTVSIG